MTDLTNYLTEERLITDVTQALFGVRADDDHIVIPCDDREKWYFPNGQPKIKWAKHYESVDPVPPFPSWERFRPVSLIVEGEFDAMVATQALGEMVGSGTLGSGTWRDEWTDALSSGEITVLYDNDEAGDKGAAMVAEKLRRAGKLVKVARWPKDNKKGFDVTDFFKLGGTPEQFREFLSTAQTYYKPGLALPATEFIRVELKDPEMLVENIWPEQGLGFVAGPPKSFKSFAALDMAFAIATGKKFLDTYKATKPRKVLLVQSESSYPAFQMRVRAASRRFGPTNNLFLISNIPMGLQDAKDVEKLEAEIAQVEPALVVLDPLSSFIVGMDENSAQEMGKIVSTLRRLRDKYRTGFCVVHHSNKGGPQGVRGGERMRGSGALYAAAEAGIWMVRLDEESPRTRMRFEQKEQEAPKPCVAVFDPVTQGLVLGAESQMDKAASEWVSRVDRDIDREPELAPSPIDLIRDQLELADSETTQRLKAEEIPF